MLKVQQGTLNTVQWQSMQKNIGHCITKPLLIAVHVCIYIYIYIYNWFGLGLKDDEMTESRLNHAEYVRLLVS